VAQTGSEEVDIVAHSTGGLIVKKYVMENMANHHIGKTVMVGVPNLGAPKAVKILLEGDNFNVTGLNDSLIKKISQNMPVAYELLPSQGYFDRFGSFISTIPSEILQPTKKLNFTETKNFLLSEHGLNTTAFEKAADLHSANFDDFNLANANIDNFNIVGCKTGTLGTFLEDRSLSEVVSVSNHFPELLTGDGTVPKNSADSLPTSDDKKFYAIKANHGKMLSSDGIRQQIVNLLTGSQLPTTKIKTGVEVAQNSALCSLTGRALWILSPVDVSVTDSFGNKLELLEDGSLQNDIPGADFEIFSDHKFVYLPEGDSEEYSINLKGTGTGTFTLKSFKIINNLTTKREIFSNIPVTPTVRGAIDLGNAETRITLDTDNNGIIDQILLPSSVISGEQTKDLTAPETKTLVSGTEGKRGFYRSEVIINLEARDSILSTVENSSGILSTYYNLDNKGYTKYLPSTEIKITGDGSHTLMFYSTDKAGNNEKEQKINLTIDTTPPEALIQFDTTLKDLKFIGLDNVSSSSAILITDNDNRIKLTDEAGNVTELLLKEKGRKRNLRADIKAIIYNGVVINLDEDKINFIWQFNRKTGDLAMLFENVTSKNNFNIEAIYLNGETKLTGKYKGGKINKTLPGLAILNVKTLKGDLIWSY